MHCVHSLRRKSNLYYTFSRLNVSTSNRLSHHGINLADEIVVIQSGVTLA